MPPPAAPAGTLDIVDYHVETGIYCFYYYDHDPFNDPTDLPPQNDYILKFDGGVNVPGYGLLYAIPDPGVGYSGYIRDTNTTNPSFPDFERVRLNSSHVPTTEAPHTAIAVVMEDASTGAYYLGIRADSSTSTVKSAFYHPDSANLTIGIVLGADPVVFFNENGKTEKLDTAAQPAAARYATRAARIPALAAAAGPPALAATTATALALATTSTALPTATALADSVASAVATDAAHEPATALAAAREPARSALATLAAATAAGHGAARADVLPPNLCAHALKLHHPHCPCLTLPCTRR